ncbi:amino acid-binding protein [Vulcanisaeta souniana]|uniref:ACT domain-containing protein n=1 Tax=Vulcanisaeta souniana JCM 11219 TaxID=1293586 RepID=A0A830EIF7_9CREN|nr:amino acid-binding protein [Vulcanisaeta souniana]BDR90970.1 hypothetical protein Vsou_00630 [Vulcanisaeta souniana JCM 11219]GGI79701.1 hypothetical protein GCM10007112_15790 [Vulcanisaeta souniana JCM 11219]
MPWLLFRVVRDRPGLLRDLTLVVGSLGLDATSGVGNTRAIMLGVSGDPMPVINGLVTEGVELINLINESVIPIAFSRRQFINALKSVLQQVGVQELGRTLYRLGYEYAKASVNEVPLGDPMTTMRTLLYTATAYNRLAFRGLEIRNNEVRVEFEEPFDEELNGSFTEGYIHGLINTALSRLHVIRTSRVGNTYVSVARPYG